MESDISKRIESVEVELASPSSGFGLDSSTGRFILTACSKKGLLSD